MPFTGLPIEHSSFVFLKDRPLGGKERERGREREEEERKRPEQTF